MDDLFEFNDVGKEIKDIAKQNAKVMFVLMSVFGGLVVIAGLIIMFASSFWLGLLGIVFGALLIYIGYAVARRSVLMMFAFGEIVDHIVSIDKKLEASPETSGPAQSATQVGTVCTQTDNRKSYYTSQPVRPAPAKENQWICSCGRNNFNYVSSCVCGKTRKDVAAEAHKKAPQ